MLLLVACGPAPSPGPVDAGPTGHRASAALQACAEAAVSPIDNAAQLVERINALPHPVSAACVVASLPRPLSLVATTSAMSAQPADTAKNPRIFLIGPAMVISVVPGGAGAKVIETGEWVSGTTTIKGEVEVPVSETLAPDALYRRVAQSNQTSMCALCHRNEAPHPSIAGAYVSVAYRPNPGEELKLTDVAALHDACVATAEASERCELLHALFDFGGVRQTAFRREVALFIE